MKNLKEPCDYGFELPDFTLEMKKDYTILAPDIFPTHMELLKELFWMYGYRVEVLHTTGKQIIDKGLEHIHNDMCYPVICMTGQQLDALTSGKYDPHKCALIQFQTGGGCRASNYIWMIRKALHNMGMDYVPVISLSFSGVEKSSGFRITPMMIAKGMAALIYGDLLMLLKNQTRPYEVRKGETEEVLQKWYRELTSQFRKNKGLLGHSMQKNLNAIVKDFHAIERKKEKKAKVGIVGEIYVKYSAFGNNGLEKFLESQDCEYMVPGVLPFFRSSFDDGIMDHKLYGGSRKKKAVSVIVGKVLEKMDRKMRKALAPYPEFTAPSPFSHIKELGDKVIGRGVKMGEGWLLPAEIAELIECGYPNVICVQPFGCLPNHIVAKGTARTIRTLYPGANLCPVDYDAGASKVNQENRIKLMLSVAREAEQEAENEKTRN